MTFYDIKLIDVVKTFFVLLIASLSLSIICQPGDLFIEAVVTSLMSILNQVKLDTELDSYSVYIGILADNINDIEETKDKLKHHYELRKTNLNFVVVSRKAVQHRMNQKDLNSILQKYHHSFVTKRTELQILVALLFWYCSQQSKYMLFTDARIIAKANKFLHIQRYLGKYDNDPHFFRLQLSDEHILGTLYNCNVLPRLVKYLYMMGPYHCLSSNIFNFEHTSVSSIRARISSTLFEANHVNPYKTVNPRADISSDMGTVKKFSITDTYQDGNLFWSYDMNVNSSVTIKFYEPIRIRQVIIETGVDIYFRDALTRAVLEKSSNLDNLGNCWDFYKIADFRSGVVNVNLKKREKTVNCLRIRLVAEELNWFAIRKIEIKV